MRLIGWLLSVAELAAAELPEVRAVPTDPKDGMVVATALAAKAAHLVSGDRKDLWGLGSYQGIQIVTPRELRTLLAPDEQERAA